MDSLEEKVSVFMDEHCNYSNGCWSENSSDSESESDDSNPIETTSFWESQLALLQEILERHHLPGSKLKQEVGEIMKNIKATNFCSCFKTNSSDCTSCLRRQAAALLCDRGISTNLRMSKWRATQKIPGGSHEYLEVIASTSTRKKQIPILIELEFRDQFQIAKAGEEYQKLVSCLPEFYIGKAEYLTAIVRVMCNAAKKSMKEKKMYLGPWRKSSFMQMKWSSFNQTWISNKSSDRFPTYNHTQANKSNMRFSGAPNAVVVN